MPPVVLSHLRGLPAICCRDIQDAFRMCGGLGGALRLCVCLFQNYVCAKDLRPVCGLLVLSLSLFLSLPLSLAVCLSLATRFVCVCVRIMVLVQKYLGYACKTDVLGQRMRKCFLALGPAWGLQIAFKLIANGAWLRGSNIRLIVHDFCTIFYTNFVGKGKQAIRRGR